MYIYIYGLRISYLEIESSATVEHAVVIEGNHFSRLKLENDHILRPVAQLIKSVQRFGR